MLSELASAALDERPAVRGVAVCALFDVISAEVRPSGALAGEVGVRTFRGPAQRARTRSGRGSCRPPRRTVQLLLQVGGEAVDALLVVLADELKVVGDRANDELEAGADDRGGAVRRGTWYMV